MKTVFTRHFDTTGKIPEDVPCVTGCTCKRPEITVDSPKGIFFCKNHGRKKTRRQWIKCQTEPACFLRYRNDPPPPAATRRVDRKRAMDKTPKIFRLGDSIGSALKVVGVTDERVTSWLGRPCGCPERRARLNALGAWAHRVLTGNTDKANEYLEDILEDS